MHNNKRTSKWVAIIVYMAIIFLAGTSVIDAVKTGETLSVFSMDTHGHMEPIGSLAGIISLIIYGVSFFIGGFFLIKTIYDQR